MTVLDTALCWLDLGVPPIPLRPASKRPTIRWATYQAALPSRADVARWFAGDACGLALVCGHGGLVVLDFDSLPAYLTFAHARPDLADTYTVRTARGRHVYLRAATPTPTRLLSLAVGATTEPVLLKGHGGYVLAPPSLHPSGARYTVERDRPIATIAGVESLAPLSFAGYAGGGRPAATGEGVPPPPTRRSMFVPQVVAEFDSLAREIKQRLSILGLLARYTAPQASSPDGRWYIMRCPMPEHVDRHPSFWADAARGVCGCHKPECRMRQPRQRPMDVIDAYGRIRGLSVREAMGQLAMEVL